VSEEKTVVEEFKVTSDQAVAKVKELVQQGNIRRVILKTEEGRTLIEVPLTLGVAAAAGVLFLAPILAAVGAFAAILTHLTIVVERVEEAEGEEE
jgi:hypothetical protein